MQTSSSKMPIPANLAIGLELLAAALLLQVSTAGSAQTPPMNFQHLGLHDGLSQGTVTSILQDDYGFLWIATENGLNRYDGHTLSHYYRDRHDAESLASDFIWTIQQDAGGDLWLATVGGGVARWDRKTNSFEHFQHDPEQANSIASNDIRTLFIDSRGNVWIGTNGRGLDRLDPASKSVTHFRHDPDDANSLSGDSIYAIYEDRSGQLWIGTDSGLNRLTGGTDFVRYTHDAANPFSLSHDHIVSVLEDHQGVLWVGTAGGGLNRLDRATNRFSHLRHDGSDPHTLSDDNVRVLLEDQANRIWAGTANGLSLLDRRTGGFTRYRNEPTDPGSLADDYIVSLYQDLSGLLWVGTRSRGVSRWNPRSWSLGHYAGDGLQSINVTSFADDGRGHVWVGTFGDGLKKLHRGLGDFDFAGVDTVARLPEGHIMSLLLDEQGNLWIGTMSSGLLRLDTETGELRAFQHDPDDPTSISADGVMTLYQDLAGNIWIGTFGGGINRLDRHTATFQRYPHSTSAPAALSSSRATTIVEDGNGALWIGTDSGGLNMLDPQSGRFRHYRHDPNDPASLSADTIYALHIDHTGTLWIGTAGGGLDRMLGNSREPDRIRFAEAPGVELPSNVVYGIQSDHEGKLWFSSNNGLTRYDPGAETLKTFHRSHGAQSEEFNFGAHHKSGDGRLYFGGTNGFNAFYPGELEESTRVPPIVLTAVEKLHRPLVTNEPYHLLEQIILKHQDKVVTFEFAALDFTAPHENRYSYFLEGFDAEWTQAGNLRRATYTNLAAGDYIFRVKAANSDGLWNHNALAIPMLVEPAPWNTAWARALYVIVVLLGFMLAWRGHKEKLRRETTYSQRLEEEVHDRTKQLERQNGELEKLSRTKSEFLARMSHEVRTPMNGVLGMAELMLGTKLNQQQLRFTETIHESAKSLLEIIDDILDYSKIEAGRLVLDHVDFDLRELIEETIELLASGAQEKGLELMCDLPPRLETSVSGDPLRLRQVLINLIGNAVKFTERGEIVVGVDVLREAPDFMEIRFEIRDTGIGIQQDHQRMIFEVFSQQDASTTRRYGGTGLGLAICKQLVELMDGRLGVDSRPGVGSTFHFTTRLQKRPGARSAAQDAPRLPRLRALIVDPNRTQRRILSRQLQALGIESLEVPNAAEALARLRYAATNEPIDVTITAHALPDSSGEELCRTIRADHCLLNLRLILLGSMSARISTQARKELRIDGHLIKPVRQRVLWQTLTVLFGHGNGIDADVRTETVTRQQGAGKRLLLVEDNAVNEAVAVGMLDTLGYRVEVAGDGQAALDKLSNSSFDAVLMDCQLPVMDGFEATAKIRTQEAQHACGRLPIIALTANATAGERGRCLKAGMDDYLSKPFTLDGLSKILSHWLDDAADAETGNSASTAEVIDSNAVDNIRHLQTNARPDLLERVIRIHLSDSTALMEKLRAALASNDFRSVRRTAHSLKSSSANLGANSMAELCQTLEQFGGDENLTGANEVFLRLCELHPRVVAALQHELEKSSASDT